MTSRTTCSRDNLKGMIVMSTLLTTKILDDWIMKKIMNSPRKTRKIQSRVSRPIKIRIKGESQLPKNLRSNLKPTRIENSNKESPTCSKEGKLPKTTSSYSLPLTPLKS